MVKVRKEFQGYLDKDWESGRWEVWGDGKLDSISDVLYDFDRKYVKIVIEVEEIE